MKKAGLLVCIAGIVFASAAMAGSKTTDEVFIDTAGRSAHASLGNARRSADTVQYMSCSIDAGVGGLVGNCYARNAALTQRSCTTNDATIIQAIGAIGSASWVLFSWDVNGLCTHISVRNGSYYSPMVE